MKNSDLIDSVESINLIAALKQPVRTSFVIALNLKAVRDHMAVFDEQRKKLVDTHTRKDAEGKPLPVYAPTVDAAGKSIIDEHGDVILDADKKPLTDKDGKPPKVIEGQIRLVNPKAFQADLKELFEIDVTKDVNIRLVKLSLLEGTVEPQHLANVLWMINDDVSEKTDAKPA